MESGNRDRMYFDSIPRGASPASRVLIVEDENLLGWSLANILRKLNIDATVVNSAECAVEELFSSEYSVVVTDHDLPEMNGVDVAKKVKEVNPGSFVIMTSANDLSGKRQGDYINVDHFVEKPFNLHQMCTLILHYLSKYHPAI